MHAREMAHEAGMSSRPEYYSGRGAVQCDLDYKHLSKIAGLIEQYHGAQAKAAFIQMVAQTPKLSATDFLLNLYRLEAAGWVWQGQSSATKGIHAVDYPTGMATIIGVLAGDNDRDETHSIRWRFLAENELESESRPYS